MAGDILSIADCLKVSEVHFNVAEKGWTVLVELPEGDTIDMGRGITVDRLGFAVFCWREGSWRRTDTTSHILNRRSDGRALTDKQRSNIHRASRFAVEERFPNGPSEEAQEAALLATIDAVESERRRAIDRINRKADENLRAIESFRPNTVV